MARFLFTSLTPPLITTASNNALVLSLAATTFIQLTCTNSPTTIISLAAIGGNLDGMVVCFSNINSSALTFTFTAESLTELTPANRFRTNASFNVAQYGAAWFRWTSVSQRWQSIAKI